MSLAAHIDPDVNYLVTEIEGSVISVVVTRDAPLGELFDVLADPTLRIIGRELHIDGSIGVLMTTPAEAIAINARNAADGEARR